MEYAAPGARRLRRVKESGGAERVWHLPARALELSSVDPEDSVNSVKVVQPAHRFCFRQSSGERHDSSKQHIPPTRSLQVSGSSRDPLADPC
ncbi:hypothetical protein NDU88_005361 [Pleurodeles waltl]|uniref:Uncharacterized protein n=1 Tax=Pleurodeles waltl TaxID=8319 RepID=A0AAV7LNZ0_PLEWA|nr:hypothetical protein NDU88_005361 [Pleurodeles waltl]